MVAYLYVPQLIYIQKRAKAYLSERIPTLDICWYNQLEIDRYQYFLNPVAPAKTDGTKRILRSRRIEWWYLERQSVYI